MKSRALLFGKKWKAFFPLKPTSLFCILIMVVLTHIYSKVAQSCPSLCNPVDCSPPGSSIHGILQARILEWVAISFSKGSSPPRDWTQVSCTAGRRFNLWATREAPVYMCIDMCNRTKIYITLHQKKKSQFYFITT